MFGTTTFTNHLLVAMPSLQDECFVKSVVYVCEDRPEGTIGLIINQPMPYHLGIVFEQLQIHPIHQEKIHLPLLFGGPIQPERGFVIHKPFGQWSTSMSLREDVTVTTSNDIIRAIACDKGPQDILVTMGFASWDENQLNEEVINNQWLVCPMRSEVLYEVPFEDRWHYTANTIGVDMNRLISGVGNA